MGAPGERPRDRWEMPAGPPSVEDIQARSPWPPPPGSPPGTWAPPPGAAPRGPERTGAGRRVGATMVGLLVLLGGGVATVASFLAVLLTANACGAFADSCEEYGETGDGFEIAAVALLVSLLATVVGFLIVVAMAIQSLVRSLVRSGRRA